MTANPQPSTSAQNLCRFGGKLREDILLIAEPAARRAAARHRRHATTRLERQLLVGRETLELRIGVRVLLRVEVVLAPRSAVVHQQRRRVGALRPRHEARDVGAERHDAH